MEFNEVLNLRRSVRKYADRDLSGEEVDAVLAAAQTAPAGSALYRDLHITVLKDRELMRALAGAAEERKHDLDDVIKTLEGEAKEAVAQSSAAPFYGAPAVFIVSHRKQTLQPGIEYCNAAIIAYTMHLAATNLGLGSVLIWFLLETVRLRPDLDLNGKLGIPGGFEPILGLAAGHPLKAPEPRVPRAGKYSVLRR